MKLYRVRRTRSGTIVATLELVHPGKQFPSVPEVYLLRHCVYHSPTGYETGYGGSGPADLALSILADFFGLTPQEVTAYLERHAAPDYCDLARRALGLHQAFKDDFIACQKIYPGESYGIPESAVRDWVEKTEQSRKARALLADFEANAPEPGPQPRGGSQ